MAKQEFLSGGFIGKLGMVIGEHWKNIRYVKAYAKPANPKSPAQRESRSYFRQSIRCAQIAYAANGHDGLWDTTTRTEFQARTSQALVDLRAGVDPIDAIPYYPKGQEPPSYTDINLFAPSGLADIVLTTTEFPLTRPLTYDINLEGVNPQEEEVQLVNFTDTEGIGTANIIVSPIGLDLDPWGQFKVNGFLRFNDSGLPREAKINDIVQRPLLSGTTELLGTITVDENQEEEEITINLSRPSENWTQRVRISVYISYLDTDGTPQFVIEPYSAPTSGNLSTIISVPDMDFSKYYYVSAGTYITYSGYSYTVIWPLTKF
jgi:hypothetical protein